MRYVIHMMRNLVALSSSSCLCLLVEALRPVVIPILFDSTNHLHRDRYPHPETFERIDACVNILEPCSHVQLMDVATRRDVVSQHVHVSVVPSEEEIFHNSIQHVPFTEEELAHAQEMLLQAHSQEYVEALESTSASQEEEGATSTLEFLDNVDHDTYLTNQSYNVCLRATAAWIACVDKVMNATKEGDSYSKCAMALTRPPGHHATSILPNGFCLLNFGAAAAIHAATSESAYCVSILDWDVHYGQGIADIVQSLPTVRYCSMHQVPAFPYQGQTRGLLGRYENVLNVPMAPDSSWTCGYQSKFQSLVLPFCITQGEWEPDLVIVCAGYDALAGDELASCNLVAKDYGTMTRLIRERIASTYKGKNGKVGLMVGLEGGYQLKDVPGGNLADAVFETVKELANSMN